MNVLTFDLEEWFHVAGTQQPPQKKWCNLEYRAGEIIEKILQILSEKNLVATFLTLGWFAKNQPGIIRKIHDCGHEIGSHSQYHDLVYSNSPQYFKVDLLDSIRNIEDVIGAKVEIFRAPSFSVKQENLEWFFETLLEAGIKYDLSIFPAKRFHGGISSFCSEPCIIETKSGELYELPINTIRVFGQNMVFSGGGYFRLFPWWLLNIMFSKSDYVMTYFHPHDFDSKKPLPFGLSPLGVWRRRYGVAGCLGKFNKMLNSHDFLSVKQAVYNCDFNIKRYKL